MAQYVAFDKNVQVNGQTILSVVDAMPYGQSARMEILEKHSLKPDADRWYSQQAWLDAFKELAEELGPKTLFLIGKAIPKNAQFPPEIDNLQAALASIDVAYHMNHKGGEIGHYTLTSFDETARKAVVVCNNPYPSEFDRGIITTMVRKFTPDDSIVDTVELDTTKESRVNGADSCTYLISW